MNYETLLIVLTSFRTNKLRTFLTLLGVIIGVTTVITVVSVVQGMNRYVINTITEAGSNTFRIDRWGIITNHEAFMKALQRRDLTMDDLEAVKKNCELCTLVGGFLIEPRFGSNVNITLSAGRESVKDLQVLGITANINEIMPRDFIAGRALTESEVEHTAFSTVLGWEVADKLFPHIDPIGKTLKINNARFHVVGVLKKYGSVFGESRDLVVYVPISTFQKMFGRTNQSVFIVVNVANQARMNEAQDQARVVLRARHHRRYKDDDGFAIMTTDNLIDLWRTFTAGAFAAMIGISSIALVVGGIVIMNIMLVSVVERTPEIGLRKALGARRREIIRQFLMESVLLAAFGGVIGILLGAIAGKLIDALSPMPSRLEAGPVIAGMLLACSVGLVSGMWPALKASRLDPIVALRTE